MANSPLTPTQRKVRRLLVKSGGTITNREISDILGLDRVHIWRSRRAIEKHRPIGEFSIEEKHEIQTHVQALDHLEEQLLDELLTSDDVMDALPVSDNKVGLLQNRLAVLNQIRTVRKDRATYLMDIGKIRRVPSTHLVTGNDLSRIHDLDTTEKLDEEILKHERLLEVIGATGR